MSWKHSKLNDSSVFRSLEKIAIEKGIVKPEEMKKEASNKTLDLSPSDNLVGNIMKLCTGLRQDNMGKYADELEFNFLNYKKAQTLYETTKETGEDLVDAAHPKGSHKLEGVEGDAVFETIIDQHLKGVEIANKKPTGKLSNAKSIIDAVKISIAEDEEVSDDEIRAQYGSYAMKELYKIVPMMDALLKNTDAESVEAVGARTAILGYANAINSIIENSGTATQEMCTKIETYLDKLDGVFDILSSKDVSTVAMFMGPWALATAPIGVGKAVIQHWDDPEKMRDVEGGEAAKLDRVVSVAKNICINTRKILRGSKKDEIKQVLINKKEKQKKQISEKSISVTAPMELHNRVVRMQGKLVELKNKINNGKYDDAVKTKAISWIDTKINQGTQLSGDIASNRSGESEVKAYEDLVTKNVQGW